MSIVRAFLLVCRWIFIVVLSQTLVFLLLRWLLNVGGPVSVITENMIGASGLLDFMVGLNARLARPTLGPTLILMVGGLSLIGLGAAARDMAVASRAVCWRRAWFGSVREQRAAGLFAVAIIWLWMR